MKTHKIKATKAKVQAYALIIDKNGMPLIDVPIYCPDEVWNGLTKEQQDFANNKVEQKFKKLMKPK